jgi:hypothetical protein
MNDTYLATLIRARFASWLLPGAIALPAVLLVATLPGEVLFLGGLTLALGCGLVLRLLWREMAADMPPPLAERPWRPVIGPPAPPAVARRRR